MFSSCFCRERAPDCGKDPSKKGLNDDPSQLPQSAFRPTSVEPGRLAVGSGQLRVVVVALGNAQAAAGAGSCRRGRRLLAAATERKRDQVTDRGLVQAGPRHFPSSWPAGERQTVFRDPHRLPHGGPLFVELNVLGADGCLRAARAEAGGAGRFTSRTLCHALWPAPSRLLSVGVASRAQGGAR